MVCTLATLAIVSTVAIVLAADSHGSFTPVLSEPSVAGTLTVPTPMVLAKDDVDALALDRSESVV